MYDHVHTEDKILVHINKHVLVNMHVAMVSEP